MKFLVVLFCLASAVLAGPTYYSRYANPRLTSYSYGYAPAVRSYSYASPYVAPVASTYSIPSQSPTAKASLAYFKSLPLDTCGRASQAFIEDVLAGASPASATEKAKSSYQQDYAAGAAPAPGSPCQAAEIAFKQAYATGQDPVANAALAYMRAYKSESPCAVAAFDYFQAIISGNTHENAAPIAMKSFIQQIKTLAAQGKPTVDQTCSQAARAYAASTGVSTPLVAAMEAFIAKALETGTGLDPVCLASADSIISGGSTLSAAKTYINLYKTSPIPAAQSPCAAAMKAYVNAARSASTPGVQAGLLSFIDDAVSTGDSGLSPACEAAAGAYIAAFEAGASELAATAKAGQAYLAAVEADPSIAYESSCAKAAKAFSGLF